ncbi:SDR family oxidoreductase [Rhodococcus oxybenzonivorans]|uniref:SDR family oxidoreductase n=1 Tax=Rhodococcus oxybenzonivorans TaxID=1990687 RepID=UPI0029536F44|nr:SDR family oxidoreductase [Rhodococcus oxybenzonivorans]MDV7353681.1 SDR family oxidoreductase [Rhodococcus oxybenzonivorans]
MEKSSNSTDARSSHSPTTASTATASTWTPPRWPDPSDIGKAILCLASDDSSYVTGVARPVDTGYLLKR